jgi:hypothetical protein
MPGFASFFLAFLVAAGFASATSETTRTDVLHVATNVTASNVDNHFLMIFPPNSANAQGTDKILLFIT